MKAAIHQPHYFPWLGLLDKIAKVDCFILADEMQLTNPSNMFRNRFLSQSGKEKHLTISFDKTDYLKLPFNVVKINHIIRWQIEHSRFLVAAYEKCDHFHKIWPYISDIFQKDYETVCQVCLDTIEAEKELLGIKTPIRLQSKLDYAHPLLCKNERLIALLKAMGANIYLSGNGARKYNDEEKYKDNQIELVYQQFTHPQYPQIHSQEFVPNLSALDLLFNCGIEMSREIFWENVRAANEFETVANR